MPRVPPIPLEKLDAQSRWLYYAHGRDQHVVKPEHVRNARHAYYGMISYVDDKVGRIAKALEDKTLRQHMANAGMDPWLGSPEEMGKLVRSEMARYEKIIQSAGIKKDTL